MSETWQLVIVGIIVTAAAAWLGRAVWRMVRPGGNSHGAGCGSCGAGGCGNESAKANGAVFVPLEQLQRDGSGQREGNPLRQVQRQ